MNGEQRNLSIILQTEEAVESYQEHRINIFIVT